MHEIETLLLLLVAVVALVASAKRLNVPYPVLLVVGGLVLGFVPGLPVLKLTPDLVFLLFLPPLLQAEAWFTSWRDFQRNLRPIGLLAIGLVLTTTVSVALVAHWLIPDFPLAAAFVLGAIAAPTDAVAVSAIGERLSLPHRILVILSGESLVNDASALVAYRTAVAAVVSGAFSLSAAGMNFAVASVGGILVGLVLGWLLAIVLERTQDAMLGIAITLLMPYIAYIAAEKVHVSGVLAVVAMGISQGRQATRILSPQQRVQGRAFWQVMVFLMNGLLFILIGLQWRSILDALSAFSPLTLLLYAVVISATVILTRICWVIPATYLPRMISSRLRKSDPYPPWQNVALIAWSGARGGVSLASALAIPLTLRNGAAFPQRDMILFLTFSIIFATLVLQGLSLPPVIRRLHLKDDGTTRKEEKHARKLATQHGLKRMNELAEQSGLPEEVIADLRGQYEKRMKHLDALADPQETERVTEFKQRYLQLKRDLLTAEREIVVGLRNDGTIGDDALQRVLRDLDLDELRFETPTKE